jgi:hypothetical protein
MPAYHYVALSSAGKELSGIIEAPDDTSARANLNQLGLSVVSLKTIETAGAAPAAPEKGKTVFEFEAIDRKNRHVVGTIVGETPVQVFGRLFDEYQLNVTSLFLASATPEEKAAARAAGIIELQKEYEKLKGAKGGKIKEEELVAAQQAERRELLEKVDFTMQSVNDFLKTYGQELKTEERDAIQTYLNQLVRIKESTNLEHIRATCEKMLDHIQKQELFLHEEDRFKESAKMKVETKELLSALKRTGLQQEIDIVKTVSRWQEIPLLRPLANFLLRFLGAQNPEIRKLREEIKAVNHHIFSYFKMLFFGKTRILKLEAWESVKTLREEKKRLKLKLHALKMEERQAYAAAHESYFWDQLGGMLGWVLAFYLLTYLVAYPFTIKNFNLPQLTLPKSFYFYQGRLTTMITMALFLAYAAVTLRNFWLKKHASVTLLLYPLTVFGFLLMVINLM